MTRLHALVREFADDDRKHDPWGSCLGTLGPVCDVLCMEGGEIPASAGYRPALALHSRADIDTDDGSGEFWISAELYSALDNGRMTLAELEYAARVLSRYAELVKLAGRDY